MAKDPPDPLAPDNVVPIKPKVGGHKRRATAGTRVSADGHQAAGEGKGLGWGGPAKGASTSRFGKGDPRIFMTLPPETRELIRRENAEIRARALARIDALIDSEHESTALQAAIAALNRVEGMPVARNVNADATGLEDWVLESLEIEKARSG